MMDISVYRQQGYFYMTRSLLVACRCRRSSRSMKLRSSDGSPGYSHCPPCSSSHVSAQANDSHHTTTHRQRLPPLPQSSPKPDASSHLCTCRGWAHHTGWEDEKTANGSIDRFARKKLRYLSSPQLLLLSLTTAQLPLNYCSTTAQLLLNYHSTTAQLPLNYLSCTVHRRQTSSCFTMSLSFSGTPRR